MKSLTFGVLPGKRLFKRAFEERAGETYPYDLRGGDAAVARSAGIPQGGRFDAGELYEIVRKLKRSYDRGDDEAGHLASSILYTIGIEWV